MPDEVCAAMCLRHPVPAVGWGIAKRCRGLLMLMRCPCVWLVHVRGNVLLALCQVAGVGYAWYRQRCPERRRCLGGAHHMAVRPVWPMCVLVQRNSGTGIRECATMATKTPPPKQRTAHTRHRAPRTYPTMRNFTWHWLPNEGNCNTARSTPTSIVRMALISIGHHALHDGPARLSWARQCLCPAVKRYHRAQSAPRSKYLSAQQNIYAYMHNEPSSILRRCLKSTPPRHHEPL